jgi:AcrR family transcriptional regulator
MKRKKRPYRMAKRARSQDETRQRIIDAAMHLHEEIGPRATTISSIAERAGVQRLTVYRHFPDETAVFKACTTHWLSLNPPPDPGAWDDTADPWDRLQKALSAFYEYYSETERMWAVSYRDVASVAALQEPMAKFEALLLDVADRLARAVRAGRARSRLVRVTVQHALTFLAWKDLHDRGLNNDKKVELVLTWLAGAALKRGEIR